MAWATMWCSLPRPIRARAAPHASLPPPALLPASASPAAHQRLSHRGLCFPRPPPPAIPLRSHTIKTFGALLFATVMTTRQFISILLSCILFAHPLTGGQWLGTVMVFGEQCCRVG